MTDKLSESRLAEIGKAHQEVCDDLEFSLDSMAEAVDAHNHRLELLCHIDALTANERALKATLTSCRSQFDKYVGLHEAKGTEDGNRKAQANKCFVEMIDALLLHGKASQEGGSQ